MHFSLPPLRQSRHPLARAFSLLIGVAVLGVLMVFGLVVVSVLVVGGVLLLALRRWKQGSARVESPKATHETTQAGRQQKPVVLEGEFVVVQRRPVTH